MSVQILDQKMLWGKAAARCSMPDCRRLLVIKTQENKDRSDIIFGENCHIVGEKAEAARGESTMPEAIRNEYHNLILLCANHHTIIDKSPGDWPIERLHQVKTDHELWIETQLTETISDPQIVIYRDLVTFLTNTLRLQSYANFSDNALRGLLEEWFPEANDHISMTLFSTIWSGKLPEIEAAIKNLGDRLADFTNEFMSKAEMHPYGNCYHERRAEVVDHSDYEASERRRIESDNWQMRYTDTLWNLTHSLNEFADAVRTHLDPRYFLSQGKFFISDMMGVSNNLVWAMYIPDQYREVRGR